MKVSRVLIHTLFAFQALLILSDPLSRATYDKLLKAKEHKAVRDRERDAKRRKLIDDLEARERSAREGKSSEADLEKQLQQEFARLREEGARILEEEARLMREQFAASMSRVQQQLQEENRCTRLTIRWNPEKGTYTREDLERFLGRHGRVSALVISKSKPGKAMVEFEEHRAAQSARKYVKGYSDAPLILSWVDEPNGSKEHDPPASIRPTQDSQSTSARSAQDDLDFEQMVFAKMRAHAKAQREKDAQASEPVN